MKCISCNSINVLKRTAVTKQGLAQYRCRHCGKYYNERSGTTYNFTQYPVEIITLVVFFYYRYKLSLVDITEIMALRNVNLSHETVRRWTQNCGTDLAEKCRSKRKRVQCKWHMDVTYLTIKGHWYYMYRAIDKAGNLIDIYLSEKRDKEAATRFFKQCCLTTGVTPRQITLIKSLDFLTPFNQPLDIKQVIVL